MKLVESQARFFMKFLKRNFDVLNESVQNKIKTGVIVVDVILILTILLIIF